MSDKNTLVISSASQLLDGKTRRDFIRLMGVGGAAIFLPSVLTSCSDDDDNDGGITGPPGSGNALVIDFAKGDTAVLQFAYALEQLEADFYLKVVASMGGFPAAEQAVLGDVKNHEVIHREAFKILLGPANDFTVNTNYGNLNFSDRVAVLTTARIFEDLGVAAYNGAAQYLSSVDNLLLAGKIVSVEARHAAAIRDLLAPKSASQGDTGTSFAPKSFDDAFRPAKVAAAAQGFIVERLTFNNAPTTFVEGPNRNG